MVKQAQTFNLRRWSARTRTRVGLPVVIAVLFSIAIVQLWTSNNDDYKITSAEQRGVSYLKPLTALMDRVIAAQSAAVRGSKIDTAGLRDSISQVDAADRANNKTLASSQRWENVRAKINELISQRPSGEAAYRNYTDAVQLIDDLVRKVADTSNLILDPTLDSYYLMDTAVLRLPNVLLFAGRAGDMASLGTKLGTGTEEQVDTRISVARYQVSLDGDEIASGLRKALDVTGSTTLGPNITNQLDAFRTAVDAFVPPVNLLQSLDPSEASTVIANADRVRDSARKLLAAVLGELDRLLQTRSDAQSVRRSQGLGIGVLCLVLTALLVWMLVLRTDDSATPAAAQDTSPASGAPHRKESGDRASEGYDPRETRASEELVHVGRGIRARRRERADDAR